MRNASISNQSIITMIKWHYKLFREVEKKPITFSIYCTGRNIICGIYKKNISKNNKKATVVGHFAEGKNLLNAKTVKTKIVYSELVRIYGKNR